MKISAFLVMGRAAGRQRGAQQGVAGTGVSRSTDLGVALRPGGKHTELLTCRRSTPPCTYPSSPLPGLPPPLCGVCPRVWEHHRVGQPSPSN